MEGLKLFDNPAIKTRVHTWRIQEKMSIPDFRTAEERAKDQLNTL